MILSFQLVVLLLVVLNLGLLQVLQRGVLGLGVAEGLVELGDLALQLGGLLGRLVWVDLLQLLLLSLDQLAGLDLDVVVGLGAVDDLVALVRLQVGVGLVYDGLLLRGKFELVAELGLLAGLGRGYSRMSMAFSTTACLRRMLKMW